MFDSAQQQQLRAQLVTNLRASNITDEKVLQAIGRVPRHLFITFPFTDEQKYADKPLEIGLGQTISQPYTVAFQSQLLQVQKGQKILEIGTGSGYQAAVLAELGANVYSIERLRQLFEQTSLMLKENGYPGIHTFYGDGNEGIPNEAPFDRILLTAAADETPKKLLKQLAVGGIMVLPMDGHIQRMVRITKLNETETRTENFGYFKFVPLLPGIDAD